MESWQCVNKKYLTWPVQFKGFPSGSDSKESACNEETRVRFPRRREWQRTPVFLPEKSHGQRSLADYSPWCCKELDSTEWLILHFNWSLKYWPMCCKVINSHLFKKTPTHYVPNTVLNIVCLYVCVHIPIYTLHFTTALWNRWHYLCFIDMKASRGQVTCPRSPI